MADGKTTVCVVVASVVLGILCLLGGVLGFYHESTKSQVLQIDDGRQQIFPFKTTDDEVPSNSMLTSTKGQKGEKGERVNSLLFDNTTRKTMTRVPGSHGEDGSWTHWTIRSPRSSWHCNIRWIVRHLPINQPCQQFTMPAIPTNAPFHRNHFF